MTEERVMTKALKALVTCMGTEAKDIEVEEVAEEFGVDFYELHRQYLALKKRLESWLDGVLYYHG